MVSWGRKSSALVVLVAACGSAPSNGAPPGVSIENGNGAPEFRFDSLDGREVSSDALRGKPAVLAFVTTYDPISQMQVNYLVPLAASLPGVNFALVMLQDDAQRELVEIYRDTLHVKFPVAVGDAATIAGGGSLGDVHVVPTIVVLGPDGKIAWRKAGGATGEEIRAHLK